MLCVGVATASTLDLSRIVPKCKLLKNFVLSIKVLSHFTITLSKTSLRYKSKVIQQSDLSFERIFFPGLGRAQKIADLTYCR